MQARESEAEAVSGGGRPQILVVDDDPEVRAVLRQGLEADGFAVAEAGDKGTLLHCLQIHPIKLITLDLGLGSQDGLELAREIRSARNVPIIMITGRSAPIDRVTGLEHGADDYITKPFHIREVVLRVRSLLRRYEVEEAAAGMPATAAGQRYAFGACILDVPKRQLRSSDGTPIDLTETEFQLLSMFLRHPARVLSRDDISRMLRGRDWSPIDRTLDGHIARLRRKIEPPGEEPTLIKSVRGVGYVFTGEVWPI
ncbi:MAG: response regulator transcription factor [Hyphomicrobium sp.]|uniref:response regulator transcription factor n=1 Tax=Hyphomicrobium sp. TaxID=82 RepID=UPI0013131539|nr:response regulator transcription factor [Hyphomicrobium sp.]KAB2910851.1 MAG: response regulator transcription factor [Hyphomicrobiaceae bacterium]MBZ0211722.1 response regulator transcription factor [Hyphomicrobium sp.]